MLGLTIGKQRSTNQPDQRGAADLIRRRREREKPKAVPRPSKGRGPGTDAGRLLPLAVVVNEISDEFVKLESAMAYIILALILAPLAIPEAVLSPAGMLNDILLLKKLSALPPAPP